MTASILPFSDEQLRVLVNLEQHYQVWMDVEQRLAELPYNLKWKHVAGKDYLYQIRDRQGNGTSLGSRSSENEQRFESYHREKQALLERRKRSSIRLDETCRLYRAARLPMIASEAAKILREADRRRLLGTHVLVVGTNAVPAYSIEAGGLVAQGLDETEDFDLAWCRSTTTSLAVQGVRPVWDMLRAVDATYTVNTERTFQARNAGAYEVELLAAPSVAATMVRGDCPTPIAMEEQEWLLKGRRVEHVVVARDGSPARLVVPDPRWFALQKLWLSEQSKRNPLKRPKDRKQALALLEAILTQMPQFPLDDAFADELPDELLHSFRDWRKAHVGTPSRPSWT